MDDKNDKVLKGDVFLDQIVFSDDKARRFVNNTYVLKSVTFQSGNNTVMMGRQGSQFYPLYDRATVTLHNVDLADVWFRGVNGGETLYAIGTTR